MCRGRYPPFFFSFIFPFLNYKFIKYN
jgi:hypothetical protein